MDSDQKHLSQITTLWSVVCNAHDGTVESRRAACEMMLERYGGAIIRYLRKSIRNSDEADELYQEWALRFVSGRLRNVDPERGRFRDYLKTVLYHLIADHWSKQKREQQHKPLDDHDPAAEPPSMTEAETEFAESWRAHLLARTWERLAEFEKSTGQPVHTILQIRVKNPNLRSPEMAENAAAELNKPVTAEAARQMLHRARNRFADVLMNEVAESLGQPTLQALEEELRDLRLYDYCRARFEQE